MLLDRWLPRPRWRGHRRRGYPPSPAIRTTSSSVDARCRLAATTCTSARSARLPSRRGPIGATRSPVSILERAPPTRITTAPTSTSVALRTQSAVLDPTRAPIRAVSTRTFTAESAPNSAQTGGDSPLSRRPSSFGLLWRNRGSRVFSILSSRAPARCRVRGIAATVRKLTVRLRSLGRLPRPRSPSSLLRGMVGPQSSLPLVVWGALSWPLRRADNEAVAANRMLGEHAMLLKLFAQGMGMNFYFAKEVLRLWGVFSQTNLRVRRPATAPDPLALRELYERLERLGLTHGVAT